MGKLIDKLFQAFQPVYETEPTQPAVETAPAQHQAAESYDYLNSLPSLFEQSTNPIYSDLAINAYYDHSRNTPFQSM